MTSRKRERSRASRVARGCRQSAKALILLASSLAWLAPESPADERVVLRSRWVRLPELPVGSWCADAARLLTRSAAPGRVSVMVTERGVAVTGSLERRAARRRLDHSRKPIAPGDGIGTWETVTIRESELVRGVDLFLPSARPDGGALVCRLQRDWRGVVWGPLTALEIELDGEKLYWVDADFDGRPTAGDRVIYGERSIWMSFHQPWIAGETIYEDVVFEEGEVRARTRSQQIEGVTGRIFSEWNQLRKDQGVPPGIFDETCSQYCVEHADYLKTSGLFSHEQDPSRPGATPGGAKAGASSVIYLGDAELTVTWALSSAYHRGQILDPRDVRLQAGGNSYAFLLGGAWFSEVPKEKRVPEQAQLSPAPGSTMPSGRCSKEWPENPAKQRGEQIGLPVFCRILEPSPEVESVQGKLFRVQGSLESGERRGEVAALLSHPGRHAPQEFPDNFGQVMLTPYQPLKPGVYEAEMQFVHRGKQHEYVWRFRVAR